MPEDEGIETRSALITHHGDVRYQCLADVPSNRRCTQVVPKQQEAQQHERLAALGTSALIFAHEVGNAIQLLCMSLDFIKTEFNRYPINDSPLESSVEESIREANRLRKLLNQFRSLAKPHKLDLRVTDLVKIVNGILESERPLNQAAGIKVHCEFETPLPPVMLDSNKITQVILNLCKNAQEAMPTGGRLGVSVRSSDPWIVVEVSDSGCGIPDGLDIFKIFETTKSDGNGLGLPIAQQIVAAHGGSIGYVTQPGRGTTFVIHLPTASHESMSLRD